MVAVAGLSPAPGLPWGREEATLLGSPWDDRLGRAQAKPF